MNEQSAVGTAPPSLRRRIDKACDRFETAWRAGATPRLEDYVDGWTDDERTALLLELVPLDADYRRTRGQALTAEQYRAAFPELDAGWLGRVLAAAAAPAPSTVSAGPITQIGSTEPLPLSADLQILEEVARGGMGVVYRCRDRALRRELAIKVLHEQHCNNPELVRRFAEEAHITGLLQHPAIVPVHAVGKLPDGRPCFTMKLIRGRTLLEQLRERPAPQDDLPRFLHVFRQVCQALAYAHACKVIHRDVKPANVMVGAFGEVQMMDWGLAKKLTSPRPEVDPLAHAPAASDSRFGPQTHIGIVMGTPAYMPPEQAHGKTAQMDARSDVFGLGALLCHILTGAPPYVASDDSDVQEQAAAGNLASALARLDRCGADAELVALCRDCLSPRPAGRPDDAGVVVTRLTAYLEATEARLRQAELEAARVKARIEEERKRRRLQLVVAVGVLIAIVVVGAAAWIRHEEQETRRAAVQRQVADLVRKARLLRTQAKESEKNSLAYYNQALTAAKEAESAARSGGADAEELASLAALREDLKRSIKLAEDLDNDRRFLKLLGDIETQTADNLRGLNQDFQTAAARYRKAFADYELDPASANDEKLRDWVAGHDARFRAEVAAAIDDWAHTTRYASGRSSVPELVKLASAIDPDPLRDQVRRAIDVRDIPTLRKLAQSPELFEAPPSTMNLLGIHLCMFGNRRLGTPIPPRRPVYAFDPTWLRPNFLTPLGGFVPQIADAFVAFGYIDDLQLGLAVLRRGQARSPDHFQINHNLAWTLLYRDRQPVLALPFARVSVALRPESVSAWRNLVRVQEELGDEVEVMAALEQSALRLPNSDSAHYWRGWALLRHRELDRAIDAFQRAVALRPDYEDALTLLASTLRIQKRDSEAEAVLRGAIAQLPRVAIYRLDLARSLDSRGAADEALDLLAAGLQAQYDAVVAETIADLLRRRKSSPQALAFLDAGKFPTGTVPDIDFLYACELLKAGRNDDYRDFCRARFQKLRDEPGTNQVIYFARMAALAPESGISAVDKVRIAKSVDGAWPKSAHLQHTLALNYHRAGDHAKAIEAAQLSMSRQPPWVPGLNQILLALIRHAQGQPVLARLHLARALAEPPPPNSHHQDRYAFAVLRREAEALINR